MRARRALGMAELAGRDGQVKGPGARPVAPSGRVVGAAGRFLRPSPTRANYVSAGISEGLNPRVKGLIQYASVKRKARLERACDTHGVMPNSRPVLRPESSARPLDI